MNSFYISTRLLRPKEMACSDEKKQGFSNYISNITFQSHDPYSIQKYKRNSCGAVNVSKERLELSNRMLNLKKSYKTKQASRNGLRNNFIKSYLTHAITGNESHERKLADQRHSVNSLEEFSLKRNGMNKFSLVLSLKHKGVYQCNFNNKEFAKFVLINKGPNNKYIKSLTKSKAIKKRKVEVRKNERVVKASDYYSKNFAVKVDPSKKYKNIAHFPISHIFRSNSFKCIEVELIKNKQKNKSKKIVNDYFYNTTNSRLAPNKLRASMGNA